MVAKIYQEIKARRQSLFPDSHVPKGSWMALEAIAGGELFNLPSLLTEGTDMQDKKAKYWAQTSRWERIILTLLFLIILFGAYWLEYRPYAARKHCRTAALGIVGINEDNFHYVSDNPEAQAQYMFTYGICMQKKGLEG